jgi:CubicO group peptidase (beta-lactamase class C family)
VPVEREVQIRDILTHTSGVVSGTNSNFANRAVAAGPKDALADYIPRLGKVPLEFQPGTRWAYSAAAGFDVLSRVVEVASGMPIDRFVKQRIFDPLEMKDTTYITPTGNARLVKALFANRRRSSPAAVPELHERHLFLGWRRTVQHGARLRAVRDDAGEWRRIEREAPSEPASRRVDGFDLRRGHAARPTQG